MRFNLSQLLNESVGSTRAYAVNEQIEVIPETGTSMVNGDINVTRLDKGVWVKGYIKANAISICARCLEESEHSVSIRLNEEYSSIESSDMGEFDQIHETREVIEEGEFSLDPQHVLDLSEAIRQNVVVNMPMKPLCRQDCEGLCSTCGSNLNNVKCCCVGYKESGWSPLRDMIITNLENN